MIVNFDEINELVFIVYFLGQSVVVGNVIVDEYTFPLFISNTYDA